MYRSQFMPQGDPIGSMRFWPESGFSIFGPDGSEWLKTGIAKVKTNYPVAASVDHLKLCGLAATVPTSSTVVQVATDGAGNFVAAYGDTTNVFVSTNSGATWSNVAHNTGKAVTGVAYGLGVFVAVGNDGSAFGFSSATPAAVASAWTSRGTQAITTPALASATVHFANSKFVAVAAGATTGAASTSTNGTSWSTANLSQAVTTKARLTFGASKWYVVGNSTAANSSTDGTTWANATAPLSSIIGLAFGAGIFAVTNGSNIYTSTDAVTWTTRAVPGTGGNLQLASLVFDGTRFLMGVSSTTATHVWYSADGIDWKVRNCSAPLLSNGTGVVFGDGTKTVFFANGSDTDCAYTADFNVADYVGTPATIYPTASGISGATTLTSNSAIGYVRIK